MAVPFSSHESRQHGVTRAKPSPPAPPPCARVALARSASGGCFRGARQAGEPTGRFREGRGWRRRHAGEPARERALLALSGRVDRALAAGGPSATARQGLARRVDPRRSFRGRAHRLRARRATRRSGARDRSAGERQSHPPGRAREAGSRTSRSPSGRDWSAPQPIRRVCMASTKPRCSAASCACSPIRARRNSRTLAKSLAPLSGRHGVVDDPVSAGRAAGRPDRRAAAIARAGPCPSFSITYQAPTHARCCPRRRRCRPLRS